MQTTVSIQHCPKTSFDSFSLSLSFWQQCKEERWGVGAEQRVVTQEERGGDGCVRRSYLFSFTLLSLPSPPTWRQM
uniref:Uncharacterized protein n=1 Tax=Octopus bimaculoides TaxID=37653 RepID=A0A0L8H7S4_OCTBM